MDVTIPCNMTRAVILDISGVYAQIYDQGYFTMSQLDDIMNKYSNTELWWVLVLG